MLKKLILNSRFWRYLGNDCCWTFRWKRPAGRLCQLFRGVPRRWILPLRSPASSLLLLHRVVISCHSDVNQGNIKKIKENSAENSNWKDFACSFMFCFRYVKLTFTSFRQTIDLIIPFRMTEEEVSLKVLLLVELHWYLVTLKTVLFLYVWTLLRIHF